MRTVGKRSVAHATVAGEPQVWSVSNRRLTAPGDDGSPVVGRLQNGQLRFPQNQSSVGRPPRPYQSKS
jgi:hypothetical protein